MKELLLALAIAHSGDLGTTQAVLRQGGTESNPLLSQRPAVNALQMAGYTALENVLLRKLAVHHRKTAKVLGFVSLGATMSATLGNISQLRHVSPTPPVPAVQPHAWCNGVDIVC